ncbi:MAG: hypothetical protein LC721_08855, partial [Actinobacteria bacterium]|nr:hypothetical protein [Actinomycetota bacterium]
EHRPSALGNNILDGLQGIRQAHDLPVGHSAAGSATAHSRSPAGLRDAVTTRVAVVLARSTGGHRGVISEYRQRT